MEREGAKRKVLAAILCENGRGLLPRGSFWALRAPPVGCEMRVDRCTCILSDLVGLDIFCSSLFTPSICKALGWLD